MLRYMYVPKASMAEGIESNWRSESAIVCLRRERGLRKVYVEEGYAS